MPRSKYHQAAAPKRSKKHAARMMEFEGDSKSRGSSTASMSTNSQSVDTMLRLEERVYESAQNLGEVGEEIRLTFCKSLSFFCQDEAHDDYMGVSDDAAATKKKLKNAPPASLHSYACPSGCHPSSDESKYDDHRGRRSRSARDNERSKSVRDVVRAVLVPSCSSLASEEFDRKPKMTETTKTREKSDEEELGELMARAKSTLITRPKSPGFDGSADVESPWTFAKQEKQRQEAESPWTHAETQSLSEFTEFATEYTGAVRPHQKMGEMILDDNESKKIVVMTEVNDARGSPSSLYVTAPSPTVPPSNVAALDPCTVVLADPIQQDHYDDRPRNRLASLNCFRKHFHNCVPALTNHSHGARQPAEPMNPPPQQHTYTMEEEKSPRRSAYHSFLSNKSDESPTITKDCVSKRDSFKKNVTTYKNNNKNQERIMMKFEQPRVRGIPSFISPPNGCDETSTVTFQMPSVAESNSVWSSLETSFILEDDNNARHRQLEKTAVDQNCYEFWKDLMDDGRESTSR